MGDEAAVGAIRGGPVGPGRQRVGWGRGGRDRWGSGAHDGWTCAPIRSEQTLGACGALATRRLFHDFDVAKCWQWLGSGAVVHVKMSNGYETYQPRKKVIKVLTFLAYVNVEIWPHSNKIPK